MKIIVFGTGKFYSDKKEQLADNDIIVSFLDNDENKIATNIDGKKVVHPSRVLELEFDIILLMMNIENASKARRQLISYGVSDDVILFWVEYRRNKRRKLSDLYGDVLIISPEVSYVGGVIAEIYAFKAFRNRGYHPVIITQGGSEAFIEEMNREDIEIRIIPYLPNIDEWDRRWIDRFRCVVVNTFQMCACVDSISRYRNVVWWLHEPSEFYINNKNMIMTSRDIDYSNVRVLAVSEIAKANFNYYVKDIIKEYLRYGIPDDAGDRSQIQRDKTVLAVIGTIYKTKGQDVLIKAFSNLPKSILGETELLVVGNIHDTKYFHHLTELAEGLCNIFFVGELSRNQMKNLWDKVDIVVCSSREDCLPIVVTEGMMHGLPCVISSNSGFSEIIKPYDNGIIFESENEIDLADKICWLVSNVKKRYQIGENGRKLYDELFSMDTFANNLHHIIMSY